MKRQTIDEGRKCPKCHSSVNQIKAGFNGQGQQRHLCKSCNYKYVQNPKEVAYPEELRKQAIKAYYAGGTGRSVGKIFNMSKANVYNWLKNR